MNNEVSNPFPSVSRLCETLSLPESKFALGWRLVDAELGQIIGVPRSRGRVVATDGMQCIVMTEDGGFFVGHYEWFVRDEQEEEQGETSSGKATRKGRKPKVLIEFLA